MAETRHEQHRRRAVLLGGIGPQHLTAYRLRWVGPLRRPDDLRAHARPSSSVSACWSARRYTIWLISNQCRVESFTFASVYRRSASLRTRNQKAAARLGDTSSSRS